jgi:UTP-glucose-1-phosphate uridylyltransferase
MKPTLLILAAGIGSRYGGLKQLDPIGPSGETIIDYSIYDALQAGFGKVVFIIKESIEKDFKETFLEKLKDKIEVDYVFQELWMVPEGVDVPETRQKPWGTGHAVMMAEEKIKTPFAVINADDFYSRKAFELISAYYKDWGPGRENDYCMIGYPVASTLSDFGAVSKGICQADDHNRLIDVVERTQLERQENEIVYKNDSGQMELILPGTIVSMNFWGFTPSFFGFLKQGFSRFIKENQENPKAEFYIPTMVNELIKKQIATVTVLYGKVQWFGMTYKEDRKMVVKKVKELILQGEYPENLWG